MSQENNLSLEEKLRAIIETVDVANMLSDPITDSIENFLHLTAKEMNSEEASVIVRDGDAGDMKFLTAIGKVAEYLKDLKIPAGKGIAGFVLSSGQPMAVADAGEEETFYAEVDKKTGYSTQPIRRRSILTARSSAFWNTSIASASRRISRSRRTRWTKPRSTPKPLPRWSTLI